ncbi:DUF4124 domain-containing protein [Shewanella psychropiezotolerans]|uniref:DUF4124 domain-containing protein n=1 Tax=Shewanella psychropiezotolerans TaxID=2593655 RepID=A0ABX5XA73_9GAMM|nr:DUF4124 domain-containing protein [Shewanella psychropiezotolerans]QDO86181.1 DUF4124 domain-containing protein [Shewanella psychropiezotolerans]
MRLSLTISLLFFTLFAQATVYKWVDKDGKIHYSDKPIENSEAVEFKSNTQNQIKLQMPKANASASNDDPESLTQYNLSIASPAEEETIRDNEGKITIMARISPDLDTKHVLVLLMDGVVVGTPQTSPIFSLKDIDRGEHSFVIKAVAQNGKQLASTPPRKIYLHRAIISRQGTPTPFGGVN